MDCIETMRSRRIVAKRAVRKDCPVKRVRDEISHLPPEIIGKLLPVRRKNQMAVRMPPEEPSGENCAGEKALSMARRQTNHQP
jgi:hypothetical protein